MRYILQPHSKNTVMGTNHIAIARKALAYAILSDMIKNSITAIGSVNTADSSKTASIVNDEVVNGVKNKSN